MTTPTDSLPDDPQEKEAQELCLQCLTANGPGSNFCRQCGAPLSSYAATGPFESLFAEGHVYRRAAEQPRRLIVVLGIWAIFGSGALGALAFSAASWREDNLFSVLFGIGVFFLSVILIGRTTKNYRKRPLLDEGNQT